MCWWSKAGHGVEQGQRGRKRHQHAKTVSRVRRNCTRITHGEAGSLEAVRRVEVEDTGGEWPSDTRILLHFLVVVAPTPRRQCQPPLYYIVQKTETDTHDAAANFHLKATTFFAFLMLPNRLTSGPVGRAMRQS